MAHTLIYGGTFDPIHLGHLIVCQRAREILEAERVLLIPAWGSPHKIGGECASGGHRMAMVERAILGEAYFLADGRELERGEREGRASFTIDTVESLRAENGGERFTLLIGADQLAKFHTWHRVRELVELAGIAVLGRPGSVMEEGLKVVGRELGEGVAGLLREGVLKTPLIEISATEVRERVRGGLSVEYLVPMGVAEYLREKGLYLEGVGK